MWGHTAAVALVVFSAFTFAAAPAADVKVTDQASYTRHDGGTDGTIFVCGSEATTPTPRGEGGGEQMQNEPAVAIKPDEPSFIVAAANDYCTGPISGDLWEGIYTSSDAGASWKNSLLPGYPGDTSAEGQQSPLFGSNPGASDPLLDWDNDGHLFFGAISFNRTEPNVSGLVVPGNGHVVVATYVRSPLSPLGIDYLRTVIVGEGTPGAFLLGRWNDKPALKVDDWSSSQFEGNVYVSWTLFPAGRTVGDSILFSRSTDGGLTFSKPIKISKGLANAQGSEIAVAPDGTTYVFWREFNHAAPTVNAEIVFVKSSDGGQHFSDPQTLRPIVGYDRRDEYVAGGFARDCGDGPALCMTSFVFHRWFTLPQATADNDGNLYVTWEQVTSVASNGDTYRPDGQSRAVVTKSTNGGTSWSDPAPVDPQPLGHQFAPNIEYNKAQDKLVLIYWDSRFDASYSVYRPPGNVANGVSVCGVPASAVCNVLNTFIATSADGLTWNSSLVSTVGHQPEYELFGESDFPFHGDYNWVDSAGSTTFGAWTDNRDVIPGIDLRETTQDGFDPLQCRTANPDGSFSFNFCINAGGFDQNIYGATP